MRETLLNSEEWICIRFAGPRITQIQDLAKEGRKRRPGCKATFNGEGLGGGDPAVQFPTFRYAPLSQARAW